MQIHEVTFGLLVVLTFGLLALLPGVTLNQNGTINYSDLVVIILASVTVIITVVGVGIAMLALWGYREFMTKAKRSAKKVADSTVKDYLNDDKFKLAVREITQEMVAAEMKQRAVAGVELPVEVPGNAGNPDKPDKPDGSGFKPLPPGGGA